MSDFGFPSQPSLFSRTLRELRELYVSSAQLCITEHPHLLAEFKGDFQQLMDDLHGALALKVYLAICEADRNWSEQERFLAEVLCHHLWSQWLKGEELSTTMRRASDESTKLKWYSLVRPFDRIAPLRERVGELETLVVRLANIIARADGKLHEKEAAAIRTVQQELQQHLRAIPIDSPEAHTESERNAAQAIEKLRDQSDDIFAAAQKPSEKKPAVEGPGEIAKPAPKKPAAAKKDDKPQPPVTVEEALAELDQLIGLDRIKHEVRTLTNFLKLQNRREAIGLPETDVSLHMVFTGNPGTGKTTVARIIGKIFAALGVLAKGHLIETDRSGLVAEYAGQTGPKTHKKVDEAIEGLLFIDEAYSLVATRGEDPYGHEAVQALLKRAEDDRDKLVVILAGYPVEMLMLLKSNPGLSSRFNRQLEFDDYTPLELARIFGLMCQKNSYRVTTDTRIRVMLGFDHQYRHRDRHFGNGRAVRNLFEHAVRRMANRLAEIAELTEEQLVELQGADIEFEDVPPEVFEAINSELKINLHCPKCKHSKDAKAEFLGKEVKCPKCKEKFLAEWGEVVNDEARWTNDEASRS